MGIARQIVRAAIVKSRTRVRVEQYRPCPLIARTQRDRFAFCPAQCVDPFRTLSRLAAVSVALRIVLLKHGQPVFYLVVYTLVLRELNALHIRGATDIKRLFKRRLGLLRLDRCARNQETMSTRGIDYARSCFNYHSRHANGKSHS